MSGLPEASKSEKRKMVSRISADHFLILGTNKEKGRCVPGPEPGTGDSLCRGLSDLDMGQGQTGILQRSPHLAVLYHAEGGGNGGGGDALVGMTADTVRLEG